MPDERCDADVILDVVFDRGLLFLVVANTGDRPAHSVRIKFDKPFGGVGGTKKMQRLALFRRLEFLAPRKSISASLTAARRTSPAKSRRSSLPRSPGGRPQASGDRARSTTTSRSTAISASSRGRFPTVAVKRDNPYLNFNFIVDIGIGDELGFSEAEVPSGEIEVIEYREGADGSTPRASFRASPSTRTSLSSVGSPGAPTSSSGGSRFETARWCGAT